MVTNNKGKHRFFENGIKVETLCKDTFRCQLFESRDFPFNHEIGVNQQKYTVNMINCCSLTRNICTDHKKTLPLLRIDFVPFDGIHIRKE